MRRGKYYFQKNRSLLIACAGIFFAACSSGSNNSEEDILLVSTIPDHNEIISPATEFMSFTFDRGIYIVDKNKITLNNHQAADVSVYGTTLKVISGPLAYGTDYVLTIEKGAIKDGSNNLNKAPFSLHFSTENEPEITADLVMPNASVQTKKVYRFLLDNYEKNVISGAMAKVSWNTDEADRVYRWTGKYPALNCFDFIHHHYSPANWINYDNTDVVENWWDNRGLVAAMWHWNVPKSSGSGDRAFYTSETSFDVSQAVQEGTAENLQIMQDMDIIAGYLLALQNKNIPVIWRPLHEAAGRWFWWGAKGAEPCKKLWIIMFDYFKSKGLNNLIWVWTAEKDDDDWYPGDDYVDMIGRDVYNMNSSSGMATEYKNLKQRFPNKIIALSECGNVATMSNQWSALALWSWFMPWYDYDATDTSAHQHGGKEFWENAFNCNYVITREQMPSLK